MLPFAVDLNPAKHGKYLPGSRIAIVNESHLKEPRPDFVVILPWNLEAEVMRQLDFIKEWGCNFDMAMPRMAVSDGT